MELCQIACEKFAAAEKTPYERDNQAAATMIKVMKMCHSFFLFFIYIHLGYSLNFTVVYLCLITGGIPPPGGGIVGKNRSTRSKTTVRRERVGPLGSRWGPFT